MAPDIELINPKDLNERLEWSSGLLKGSKGTVLKNSEGYFSFVSESNYSDNFGFQWNKFEKTQIDRVRFGQDQSKRRLFLETGWEENFVNENVLEVGSGAGRFTKVLLENSDSNIYSVDYSEAVRANFRNNGNFGTRLRLFRASIYELPFVPRQFDKVLCLGVLQHTPNPRQSVRCLADMVKPGGELVLDFYPIRYWWTKIHAKYIFRGITKRMSHQKLYQLIEYSADTFIALYRALTKVGLHAFTRFIPICDIHNTLPRGLNKEELREWVILDTFDMFSPEYDQPQKIATVAQWFKEFGLEVTFDGFIDLNPGQAAVVRGTKI